MKALTVLFVVALFLATTAASSLLVSGAGGTEVDGAGRAAFPSGTIYNGVTLNGSQFGKGVVINADGSAIGNYYTVLEGVTPLGPQNITVTGWVSSGSGSGGGSATFGGTASVDMGDGTPPLSVPFSVAVTSQGITLVLNGTTLPTQTITDGGIDINPW